VGPTSAQLRAAEAYKAAGYKLTEAAKNLGMKPGSLKETLFTGHLRGLTIPTEYCQHLPAGMVLNSASIHVSKDGKTSGWYKGTAHQFTVPELAAFLRQRIPVNKLNLPKVSTNNSGYMLMWPIYDPHHGMLAWADETGNDYDHKISRHLQVSAAKILFSSFGRVKRAVIILGGDNQTSDNRSSLTEKSKNSLDTDTRYPKMAWCTYETSITCIEVAEHFADEVYVVVLSGNHDYHAAIHLTITLHAHFRNSPNVTIDISPEKHRFFRWGNTVFMATHGDTPDKRIATYALQQVIRRGMARDCDVERVRVLMGHLHKKEKKTPDLLTEEDGVVIERFPTLAAQEAYSIEGAYTSCRATEANLWHHKHGRHGGREITIGEILERYPI